MIVPSKGDENMKNRIAEARAAKGYSLRQLAELVGLGNNTISQYETGKREPKLETWRKLAEALDVSVPYLQGVTDTDDDFYLLANSLAKLIGMDADTVYSTLNENRTLGTDEDLWIALMFTMSANFRDDYPSRVIHQLLDILKEQPSANDDAEAMDKRKIYSSTKVALLRAIIEISRLM